MTQALPPCALPRLYSQTDHDDRGNFHYDGDLYRPGEALPTLCARIESHLHNLIAGARFTSLGERYAGGRKVTVELLDSPADLTEESERRAFTTMVRDQIERFGFTRSNFYQDYLQCAFHSDVQIGKAYWSALAARRGTTNQVEPVVSLAAFKRRIKTGDRLKLVAAPNGHRALGTTKTIKAVRSGDLIFEGDVYLDFPRAAGFACDGRLVRIAIGNEHEPDRHLLYEWLPGER